MIHYFDRRPRGLTRAFDKCAARALRLGAFIVAALFVTNMP